MFLICAYLSSLFFFLSFCLSIIFFSLSPLSLFCSLPSPLYVKRRVGLGHGPLSLAVFGLRRQKQSENVFFQSQERIKPYQWKIIFRFCRGQKTSNFSARLTCRGGGAAGCHRRLVGLVAPPLPLSPELWPQAL